MSIKKLSFMLLCALSLAALLNGCGSSSKAGVNDLGGVAKVDEAMCRVCHSTSIDPVSKTPILVEYLSSSHFANEAVAGCQGCHGGGAQHNGVGPIPFNNPLAANRCILCHTSATAALFAKAADFVGVCAPCHSTVGGGIHSASLPHKDDCIGCHDVGRSAPAHRSDSIVNDNNGVRAITGEFSKWSHHVTGVNLQNAHCAACHLEGNAGDDGAIHVDKTFHMVDGNTHLRNADTDADMKWDPAAPNHSTMDNFCMSCHDADGATSPKSAAIRALMVPAVGKTASASNPFGDTISNRYDKMQRPAVVDASSQFNTTNNSHHAVKGPKYSGRTRAAGPRQIANPAAFAANSSATLFGRRSTIYDFVEADPTGLAGAPTWSSFNALYVPLENAGGEAAPRTGAQSLGDDSTLHCGDCHTVGQWKAGTAKWFNNDGTVDATKISPAIGAHGSNNEYLLRNSKGTDQRHTQNAFVVAAGVVTYTNPNGAFLVCYNCHSYGRYGSVFLATGAFGGHVGEYDATGRCNGVGNTIPFNGYTTGKATDGTQFITRFGNSVGTPATTVGGAPTALNFTSPAPYAGEQIADFGNVFGIQCANCHNSGSGNAYGGIHGSAKNQTLAGFTNNPSVTGGSYIDGAGNTTKIVRFLPGLGDAMHVPGTLGGITGGTTATFLRYSGNLGTGNAASTIFTSLPVRDNRTAVNAKIGSYTYTTGGVTNDTNWEQKHWLQDTNSLNAAGVAVAANGQARGAGCYTLGSSTEVTGATSTGTPGLRSGTAGEELQAGKVDQNGVVIPKRAGIMDDLRGPSQGVAGQPNPEMFDNWGACDDHSAPAGGGNHGFIKKVVRPVTY